MSINVMHKCINSGFGLDWVNIRVMPRITFGDFKVKLLEPRPHKTPHPHRDLTATMHLS